MIRGQRPVLHDRRAALICFRAYKRLENDVKRLKTKKRTTEELKKGSPEWFRDLADFLDSIMQAIKE